MRDSDLIPKQHVDYSILEKIGNELKVSKKEKSLIPSENAQKLRAYGPQGN